MRSCSSVWIQISSQIVTFLRSANIFLSGPGGQHCPCDQSDGSAIDGDLAGTNGFGGPLGDKMHIHVGDLNLILHPV